MTFTKIMNLRKEGKLKEAHQESRAWMASASAGGDPNELVWAKRAMSWVLYDYVKWKLSGDRVEDAEKAIEKIMELDLDESETLFMDAFSWQAGSFIFKRIKSAARERGGSHPGHDVPKSIARIFDFIKKYPLTRPSDNASFLLGALHKGLRDTEKYLELMDWFGFENLQDSDYLPYKNPDGKNIMSLAEQIYSAFTAALLEGQSTSEFQASDIEWRNFSKVKTLDTEKIRHFIGLLGQVEKSYPRFRFTRYNMARLYAALEEYDNAREYLIPFVCDNQQEYWAWVLLGDIVPEAEYRAACYCKALQCPVKSSYLVSVRPKLVKLLIDLKKRDEARTEIDAYVSVRNENNWKISAETVEWMESEWYAAAKNLGSNESLYESYSSHCERILFSDIPEQLAVVTRVNRGKKILNFLNEDKKEGFFSYRSLLKKPQPGDVLKVRLSDSADGAKYGAYSAKSTDNVPSGDLCADFEGVVKRREDQNFALVTGTHRVFVEPALVESYNLKDGLKVSGRAVAQYDKKRKEWGLKAVKLTVGT